MHRLPDPPLVRLANVFLNTASGVQTSLLLCHYRLLLSWTGALVREARAELKATRLSEVDIQGSLGPLLRILGALDACTKLLIPANVLPAAAILVYYLFCLSPSLT